MDGLKGRLNASIQSRLSLSLAIAVIAIAVAAGAFSFVSAFHRAQETQDDVLFQIAELVSRDDRARKLPAGGVELEDSDHDSWVYVQVLGPGSARTAMTSPTGRKMPVLAATLADGMHTLSSSDEEYRVFVRTTPRGERIAVSQETALRNEIAYRGALDTLLPFLILVPVLLIIIAQIIRRIFRPVTALARQIDARSENDLRPVPEGHLPQEIRPFILAINRLLGRVDEAVRLQRRFVADAAHELRSPLTALSLQAERMDHLPMSDAARERLHILESGILRGRKLLNQLLSLSRVQSGTPPPPTRVQLRELYRDALEDSMPLARARRIDVGVLEGSDATLCTDALNLATLVRNLIDNAIRYTPPGGRVDLSAEPSPRGARLRIADTGPGIPLAERERVFDSFHRILGTDQVGSGLGLAIVRAVAERLGASIELAFTDPAAQTGLTVTVEVPDRAPETVAPPLSS